MKKIGVLALQGDFEKHLWALERCGRPGTPVRTTEELTRADGLIIPGGESTAIGKLMDRNGLLDPIKKRARQGFPIFGTCAGMILLAKTILNSDQIRLGLLDITVERNSYGRQIESFEADLESLDFGPRTLRGIFIRAPQVRKCSGAVKILARFNGAPVLLRQDRIMAGAFHPELTEDLRVHQYFLDLTAGD